MNPDYQQISNLDDIVRLSDILALHVHVTNETKEMINSALLSKMKKNVIIINTSRGELINEDDLISFLEVNPQAKIATDVLYNEAKDRLSSSLLKYSHDSDQVLITPHIGGMTLEGQKIAYTHAANMLLKYVNKNK